MKIAVVIPYAGEHVHRLRLTAQSVDDATPWSIYIPEDRLRSLPETFNRGARAAIEDGASHICWVSTGDLLHPQRFEAPISDDAAQFCQVRIPDRGEVIPAADVNLDNLATDNQFCMSGAIWPSWMWKELGGLDEGLRYCSDWDIAVRTYDRYTWEGVFEELAIAREYPGGLTDRGKSDPRRQQDRATVARRARGLRN